MRCSRNGACQLSTVALTVIEVVLIPKSMNEATDAMSTTDSLAWETQSGSQLLLIHKLRASDSERCLINRDSTRPASSASVLGVSYYRYSAEVSVVDLKRCGPLRRR